MDIKDAVSIETHKHTSQKNIFPHGVMSLYLKEVNSFPLLTREDEMRIARKIASARNGLFRIVFSAPFVIGHIIEIYDLIEKKSISIDDLILFKQYHLNHPPDAERHKAVKSTLKKIKSIRTYYMKSCLGFKEKSK